VALEWFGSGHNRRIVHVLREEDQERRQESALFSREDTQSRFHRPRASAGRRLRLWIFVTPMKEKGWSVYGVAAERGRSEGFDILGGFIDRANFPSEYFDYVRSNHSFEHMHNPREVLREMRHIIKPSGYLFIRVPNVKGLQHGCSEPIGGIWGHRYTLLAILP